jgi:hypothetical protein
MAYDEVPRKPIEVREGRKDGYYNHDQCIENGGNSAVNGFRTDAAAEGVGYLCVDDLDRIRRKNLKHKTR